VTLGGGTFFLNVTSAAQHDFRACGGSTPFPGTLDTLLGKPGMDRRCVLDSAGSIGQYHALVAVYSDTTNLQAAQTFCTDNNGTMG
jgi:CTP-dependent riboflavin kinase